jgi:hypothetical protein
MQVDRDPEYFAKPNSRGAIHPIPSRRL